MSDHKTFFGKLLAGIGRIFNGGLRAFAKTAVVITEEIKTLLDSGLIQGLATFMDSMLKTHIAEDILQIANAAIPNILAIELSIQGLPDNPTEQEILDFENAVYKAITGLPPSGASKLYTTLTAQIYAIIKPQIDGHEKFTFALLVNDVEAAYQAYKQDLADMEADSVS